MIWPSRQGIPSLVGFKKITGRLIEHGAVVVVNLLYNPGVEDSHQRINVIAVCCRSHVDNQPFIDLAYLPMCGDAVFGFRQVVILTFWNVIFSNKLVVQLINIFTMIDISIVIYMPYPFLADGIDHHIAPVSCLASHVLYQPAHKKQVILLLDFPSFSNHNTIASLKVIHSKDLAVQKAI